MKTAAKVWLIIGIALSAFFVFLVMIGVALWMFLTPAKGTDFSVNTLFGTVAEYDESQETVDAVNSQEPQEQTHNYNDIAYFISANSWEMTVAHGDVCQMEGTEYVCLDGNDTLSIVAYRNNSYHLLYQATKGNTAYYFADQGEARRMLSYCVTEHTDSTTYEYDLFYFDENGNYRSIDSYAHTHNHGETNANGVADFYKKFNNYTDSITVLYDPYRLTGEKWMNGDTLAYGNAHEEAVTNEQLGYVQINDPKTWLNLREGPSTKYPCIYTQPGNKKSIVKQAQGAPVTILDRVETGDKKNPVWYQVRITYNGKEYVGYSSAKYIRTEQ